jgi:nucleotide-binding universal stress UspA family protein
LTLLRVLEADTRAAAFSTPTDPLDWGIREREARAHLEDVASKLAVLDQEIRSELIQGQPAEQICCWVENHQVDLTVLCSHGSRGRTDWDLASTARKLIDRIPGSLLLIPAEVAAAHHEVRYQRLLVPLDGSSRAESVVPLAMRIAASQGAEILLVHVVENPEIFRHGLPDAEGADLERRVADHNQRVSSEYLDRLRTRVNRTGVRVRSVVVRDGSVRTRLQQVVRDEKIDLVVMSAHGSAGRLDSPCGSVTEHALTHAVVPLLVLRDRVCRCRPKHRADDANPRRLKRPDPPDPTVT